VYLVIIDPPPNVLKPQDVSVIPGDSAMFTCIAFSTVDFNLTWLRYNSTVNEYSQLADNTEVFGNGSLIIRYAAVTAICETIIFFFVAQMA